MTKTPISDVVEAVKLVLVLQDVTGNHERAIGELADRMARLEKRLDEVRDGPSAKPG